MQISVSSSPADIERLVAPIVVAFAADPFVRWFLPDSEQYLTYFPSIVRLHAQRSIEHRAAYEVDGFKGTALWCPPGVHSDREALGAVVEAALDENEREKAFAVFRRVGESEPGESHWYLHLIGVDAAQQGRGYGSALLSGALQDVDRRHLSAYLESTSPGSKALYERHGFEAFDEIQVGDSPPLWPMLRSAR